jgi:ATP-binding cassette subfamily B protein
MERGKLIATGTHGDLIRQGGLYARLASLQFDLRDDNRAALALPGVAE